jgi:hypothetical protein
MRTNYYENFPTYGKVKETCPRCKKSITQWRNALLVDMILPTEEEMWVLI